MVRIDVGHNKNHRSTKKRNKTPRDLPFETVASYSKAINRINERSKISPITEEMQQHLDLLMEQKVGARRYNFAMKYDKVDESTLSRTELSCKGYEDNLRRDRLEALAWNHERVKSNRNKYWYHEFWGYYNH